MVNVLHRIGLKQCDTIVDLGAGMCDLDYTLRQRGWFGRYVPVDGDLDPSVNLETWYPTFGCDFYVCIDTTEHLHEWKRLIRVMKECARKGVVVSTADADTVDVYAMHPTHVSAQTRPDLEAQGLVTMSLPLVDPNTQETAYTQSLGFWAASWADS